jgi:hypothetical protein
MEMRSLSTTLAACFLLQHVALTGEAQARFAALRDTTAPATQLYSMMGPCHPRHGRGCAARLEGGERLPTLYTPYARTFSCVHQDAPLPPSLLKHAAPLQEVFQPGSVFADLHVAGEDRVRVS